MGGSFGASGDVVDAVTLVPLAEMRADVMALERETERLCWGLGCGVWLGHPGRSTTWETFRLSRRSA